MINIKKISSSFLLTLSKVLYLSACIFFLAIGTSRIWGIIGVEPLTYVIPMYYGRIYNHTFHSNFIIIVIGLLQDAYFSSPLGLTTAALIIMDILLSLTHRKIKTPKFLTHWMIFFIYILPFQFLLLTFHILISQKHISFHNILENTILTWVMFPFSIFFFHFLTQKLRTRNIGI